MWPNLLIFPRRCKPQTSADETLTFALLSFVHQTNALQRDGKEMIWGNMWSEANQNTGYPHFRPHTGLTLNKLPMFGLVGLSSLQVIKVLLLKKTQQLPRCLLLSEACWASFVLLMMVFIFVLFSAMWFKSSLLTVYHSCPLDEVWDCGV